MTARLLQRGLALLLIIALAAGGAWLAQGVEGRWVWAGAGPARLGEASERLLADVPAETTVRYRVLVRPDSPLATRLQRLVTAYREAGLDLALERLHPDRDAERLREYGLGRDGEGLLGVEDEWEHVAAPAEARVSAALERLLRRGSRYIVHLTGHGERELTGEAGHALGRLGQALERKGYRLQPLDPERTAVIPDNTRVLLVAGPTRSLPAETRQLLAQYIARGGRLLWLTDPGAPPLPAALPVTRGEGVVVDPQGAELLGVDDPALVVAEARGGHPALTGLGAPLLLNRAAPLRASAGAEWRREVLLATGPRQWPVASERLQDPGEAPADAGGAPLALTLARDTPEGEQRLAVFGDSDLFANAYIGNGDNLALALNTIDWLADQGGVTGRYGEAAGDRRLRFSRHETLLLGFGFLAGLPAVFLLGGWLAWRRGRSG
ncbi:DUF4350 domain-containing protein [Spiribacter halobius]|uniref:DUF4350 domain-containing protein n=1 Tax=Sediminicurvatus halobius TaxID=2182432 RepID=UPI001304B943|nr:DUF4350 domain-containing protein [Spiribacter halobius]UEX78260.1 Gldg family protein [Spiribacter halobius]